MKAIKQHLSSLTPYPYATIQAPIKLDQNESPFDVPAPIKERALARLRDIPWNRYPEMGAADLRAAIARHTDWSADGVAIAPGSNFLIHALAHLGARTLDTAPSFAYYEGASRLANTPYESIALGEGFALPVQALCDATTQGEPGVLFLANPHAPTGQVFPRAAVETVVRTAAQAGWIVVIDEAYVQFAGTDHRDLARAHANVVLLRTFSKAFCLGGIRAGYLLGAAPLVSRIQAMLPPFLLPAHSDAILKSVLESPGYVDDVVRQIVAERERVRERLLSHPTWKVHPSHTNFLLVRTPHAKRAFDALLARGILVRRQDHCPGLSGCLRVTLGTRQENDAFLAAAQTIDAGD